MTQNTSSAVMAQRREPPDALDFFPTPPWATRALCEHGLAREPGDPSPLVVWDPACGAGHMARTLREYYGDVLASDVFDYGFGGVHDFLQPYLPGDAGAVRLDRATKPRQWCDTSMLIRRVDLIVTNPPFVLAEQFVARAMRIAPRVAMLVRTPFLEGEGRWERLFSVRPPARIHQFVQRVPMLKGRCPRWVWHADKGRWERPSTASAYAWVIWKRDHVGGASFHWIPPCRVRLERWGDYDDDVGPERAGPPPRPETPPEPARGAA